MYKQISKFPHKRLRHYLAMPFIFSLIFPLIFLDIMMEIYHRVCFPLYNFKYVSRRKYIKIDRHKLKYLDVYDKLWCVYCGYANGLLAYNVKIAGETEKYWCGIKHKLDRDFIPPEHHKYFLEYNDKKAYEDFINQTTPEK